LRDIAPGAILGGQVVKGWHSPAAGWPAMGEKLVATQASSSGSIDIGRVLSRTFEALRKQAGILIGLAIVLVGVPQLALQYFLVSSMRAAALSHPANPFAVFAFFTTPLFWGSILVGMIVGMLLQAAVVRTSICTLLNEPVDFGATLTRSVSLLLPMIGLAIVSMVIFGVGLILLLVPGIIAYVHFVVAVPVLVEERKGVFGSLARSSELTKGSRWQIFGLLVLVGIATAVLGWILRMIGGLGAESIIVTAAIQAINSVISWLFSATMVAALYVELRVVREGGSRTELSAIFA